MAKAVKSQVADTPYFSPLLHQQKHRAKRQKQVDEDGISISMNVSSKFGVLYFWKANRKDAPIHAFAAASWYSRD